LNVKKASLFRTWWVWAILGFVFLIVLAGVVGSRYMNPWLKSELESRVQEESQGLYTLRVHGLETSLLGGRVTVDSLQLIPDFELWQQRKHSSSSDSTTKSDSTKSKSESTADSANTAKADNTGKAASAKAETGKLPRTLVNLTTKDMVLSGINFVGLLRGEPLDLDRLRVQQPQMRITEMRQDTTDTHEPLHESVDGIMRQLKIKTIEIVDGSFLIRDGQEAKSNRIEVAGLQLNVKGMQLDSVAFRDEERAYYAQGIALETGKASFLLPDGSYRLQVTALKANTADGTLNLGNLELVPLLKNAALARRKGSAATTMRLKLPELNASGVNFKLHSRHNNLAANLVVLQSPSLSAYMDRKNFPVKGEKPLPHDFVQQLKTGMAIQRIEVKGMRIRYEELAPEATETGVITFESLFATITNVNNDKNRMSAKSPAVVDAKASINGDAPLAVTIRLNLLDPNGYHTIQGSAGPANPATLNPILEPTTFISIKEGSLQKSDFKMELTRHKATGNLNARYQNFRVDLLTKDDDKRQSLGKKVLSKVANKVVINSHNPKNGDELRPGTINVVRARNRSVFNYWKDCLVGGFRTAAGIEGVGADLQDPNR
jgi:hypothetical protein